MQTHGLDALIIPSNDPHQSEYVAEHWKSRTWISGFTGSAGLVSITHQEAILWTDSRYTLQAVDELEGTPFKCRSLLYKGRPAYLSWLTETLESNSTLGLDGRLFSKQQYQNLEKKLSPKKIKIQNQIDPFESIWKDRPALPVDPIFDYDIHYAGESRTAKFTRVRALVKKSGAEAYLVTRLDDIAWLLNLRGADVSFNPVFYSYVVILPEQVLLFINAEKIKSELKESLQEDDVRLLPYHDLPGFLKDFPAPQKILLEPSTSILIHKAVKKAQIVNGTEIIQSLKAIKNPTEIDHTHLVMEKDGVALCRFFRWLEIMHPSKALSEHDLVNQLQKFRGEQEAYFGESFSAIVGFRENGAIVHYRPDEQHSALINKDGILLIDSGGQYLDGTTDITRTISIGQPTEEQRDVFTLVLKGHIALDLIHFPKGTTGTQLDVLARMHLWKTGRNFGHGTGHGVGFFLNVHEGPQGFSSSTNSKSSNTPFQAGMITSNEPGFYKAGAYGIRIENLILCTNSIHHPDGSFLQFETLTLFPLDLSLIQPTLLTQEELEWINNYHQKVYERLAPHLNPDEKTWLAEKCMAVTI